MGLCFSSMAFARDRRALQDEGLVWTAVKGRYHKTYVDQDVRTIVLIGDVKVSQEDFELLAEAAVVWIDLDREPPRYEMYAEGKVRMRRGSEVTTGDSVCMDFTADKAEVINGAFRLKARSGQLITIQGRRIVQRDRDTVEAEDAVVSTCSFKEPHVSFTAKHILLREKERTVSRQATIRIGQTPVLYTPILYKNLKHNLIRDFSFGSDPFLGDYYLLDWGFDLSDRLEMVLDTDHYGYRGLGYGVDLNYNLREGFGFLDTYFLHDAKDVPGGLLDRLRHQQGLSEEQQPSPFDESGRSRRRVRWLHHQVFPGGWAFDGEVFLISDRRFQEEFFEDEFRNDKIPESNLLVTRNWDHYQFSVLARPKLNAFQTQTEYLPKIGFDVGSLPVSRSGVLFHSRTQAASVRRDFDDTTGRKDFQTARLDTFDQFSVPFHVGFLGLEPFAGVRGTWYADRASAAGDDAVRNPDDVFRMVGQFGIRAGSEFYRSYDLSIPSLGMEGLRHVVKPDCAYLSIRDPSVSPDGLLQFDEIDAIDRLDVLEMNLENILETKLNVLGKKRRWRFVRLKWTADFFPNADRDNGGHHLSAFDTRFRMRPSIWLSVFNDTTYNTVLDAFDEVTTGVSFNSRSSAARSRDRDGRGVFLPAVRDFLDFPEDEPGNAFQPRWFLSLANHDIRDAQSLLSILAGVALSERWSVIASGWYEWNAEQLLFFEFGLERGFHDFALAWNYRIDRTEFTGKAETSFSFSFTPRFGGGTRTRSQYRRQQRRARDVRRTLADIP